MAMNAEMNELQVHDFARQMLNTRGGKAVADAALKAQSCEENGQRDEAQIWRKVEAALKLMRGPHQG